jgi:2-oxoisovalerate dehydrogenase E1 component alpha subunit
LWRLYRQTIRLREMDTVLLNAQRQGRISFYMTCTGEEAIHLGVASALDAQDHVLAQYREQGVIMWRGFTLEQFTNQCFSNELDLGKGRQMPIHYGSRALNYHTISSPLGTQLTQAVGVAYRLKMMGSPNVAVAFFGEGCASTPDFHSALNFAATLQVPCIFFCRNNGYAISTPINEQYAGDGIVSRAPGYGIAGIRVDGNDFFAVNAAVREARKYALVNKAPVLIEGMTYRQSHHSTSDDSSAYRNFVEVSDIIEKADPLRRLEAFLQLHGWLDENEKNAIKIAERTAVLHAFQQAEKRPKPIFEHMFEDIYCVSTPQLRQQKAQLVEHMEKYPDYYSELSH